MNRQPYLLLSATLFSLVALGHLARLILHWPARLGPFDIPFWISWGGFAAPAILGLWGFSLARAERRGAQGKQ